MEIEGDKFLRLTAKLAGFVPAIACTWGVREAEVTRGEGTGESLGGGGGAGGPGCVGGREGFAGVRDAGDAVGV